MQTGGKYEEDMRPSEGEQMENIQRIYMLADAVKQSIVI